MIDHDFTITCYRCNGTYPSGIMNVIEHDRICTGKEKHSKEKQKMVNFSNKMIKILGGKEFYSNFDLINRPGN